MTIPTLSVCFPAERKHSYPIWIDAKLLENIALWMPKNKSTIVIITDNLVKKYYLSLLETSLKNQGYTTLSLVFIAGEQSKNNYTKCQLEEKMLEHGCDRDTLILALGGGVVGDLAGFIAATYMRGIDYIQIPTTLLAMVDGSVGGKTGIDTSYGKNLIGAFWQPLAVVSDLDCLKTLSKKQFINGLIEALKMFLTSDANSVRELEQNLDLILNYDKEKVTNLICQAVQIKSDIVIKDERDNNKRAILNFGHTIGHALEQIANYKILHGHAVALGILVEAKIAQLMGFLEVSHYQFIKSLLSRLNISANDLNDFQVDKIIQITQLDKKKRAGRVRYVLLNDLGSVHEMNGQFTHVVADEVVKMAFLESIED